MERVGEHGNRLRILVLSRSPRLEIRLRRRPTRNERSTRSRGR